MPQVETAEEAVRIAGRFLSRYYGFHRLQRVVQEDEAWVVEFDVSVLGPKEIIRIRLKADTGTVIEYTKI